jgi:DNA-binding CsgD family transcriptional regulator
MLRCILITSFCIFLSFHACAGIEKIENMCVPKITYFDKDVYHAANQTWSIAQNKRGYLYFANSAGLLEYDGSQWSLYVVPNNSAIVRSVAITNDQKIYIGTQNEFGYWSENIFTRKLNYTSLTKEFNLRLSDEEIWKVIVMPDAVYFHSFKNIYKYNVKLRTISIISAPHRFQFLFEVNNRLFVQEKELGLMELKEDRLSGIPGGEVLSGDCVYGMASLTSNSILIATMDKGLYKIEGERVSKCPFPCNGFLIKNQIFSLSLLPDGRFAFGTILGGLLITDHAGTILSNINKPKGMPNNTVLSMFSDQNNNLWLGLDRGICHIQLNSPIRTFPDPKGELGSVYQVEEFNGKLFFATNQGLFYCKIADLSYPERELQFTLMPKAQGQVWSLQKIGNRLFCCHNKGLYVVEGEHGDFVYTGSGVRLLEEINQETAVLATYDGLCVLKMRGTTYSVKKQFVCPYNLNYLAKDKNDNLYVGNGQVGLFLIKFDADFSNAIYCNNQLNNIGVHPATAKGVFSYKDNLYLLDATGILKFDNNQNRFLPDKTINRLLPSYSTIYRLQLTDREMWCYASDRFFCIRDYDKPSAYLVAHNMESLYHQLLYWYENILNIQSNSYLVCTSNCFAVLKTLYPSNPGKKSIVYLRDIGTFTNKMTSMPLSHDLSYYEHHTIELPHSHNTIYIRFTLPEYENTGKICYSYRLKGSSDNFSIPSQSNVVTFTHLPAGDYIFQVKATVEGTNDVFYSQELQITILPPWYLGWMGACLLALLLSGVAFAFSKYINVKWQKRQQHIIGEHEKEMAHMENKLLQEQVSLQKEELLRVTKTMLHKSKLMNKLDNEIVKMSINKSVPASELRGLKQIVEKNKNPEEEWKIFEMSFNNTYDNYLVKLNKQFPGLTTSDLKLAAYIRMNISSKEISALLNISVKSIEMGRYRLRKKLGITHEENLTEFLMGL